MGTPITGREIIVGLKKATTWGTAVACGANDGLLILSESLGEKREVLKDDSGGHAFVEVADQGKVEAAGAMDGYLRYEGWDLALALLMGAAGTPSQQESTSAYTNTYTMATDAAGLFATLAMKKKSDVVHEFPALKPNGFKISGAMNAPLKISLDSVMDRLVLNSETNTTTTMADVTYPDETNRIIFNSAATFKINDQDGDALDADDKIYPSNFELSFKRKQSADFVAGSGYVAEPSEDGFPEALLTLDFPRYNDANHAFFTDWHAWTKKKMEILFTGSVIAGAYAYYFKVEMPNMAIIDPAAAFSGPGKIPAKLQFDLLGCAAAPTGMTGITTPFKISVCNTRTTSPLA